MTTAALTRRRTRPRSAGYWLYLLPMIAGTLLIVLLPFAVNVFISLFRWKGGIAPMRWNGLQNYVDLLNDAQFWLAFKNTIFMIVGIVVIPTLLGLLLAAMLFDYIGREFGGKAAAFLRATYYLPQILPIAVAGFIWSWVLATQNGLLNSVIEALGVISPPDWLGDPNIAIYAVMLMLIWLQLGYPVVIFMAALQRVDPELYEAAELDGANWFQRFRSITVSIIRPEIFVVTLTCTIAALKVFGPVYTLTRGGPGNSTMVPSVYSYSEFFQSQQVGYGATIATALTVVIVAVSILFIVAQNRAERRENQI